MARRSESDTAKGGADDLSLDGSSLSNDLFLSGGPLGEEAPPIDLPYTLTPEEEEALRQRPAAFQFGVVKGKIDALPYSPEAPPTQVQQDLYDELKDKLACLAERITRTNAAPESASFAVDRMRQALGADLSELRPGLLLSRSRTLESVRGAFDTEQARDEIAPELLAMMEDAGLSAQDLLASYPETRKIERERLALGIERKPEVLDQLETHAGSIADVARQAEIVTDRAADALEAVDPDLKRAKEPEARANILADKLLTLRNFLAASVRACANSGISHWVAGEASDAWDVVKPNLHRGLARAAQVAPIAGLALFFGTATLPLAALAVMVRDRNFKFLDQKTRPAQVPGSKNDNTSSRRKFGNNIRISFNVLLFSKTMEIFNEEKSTENMIRIMNIGAKNVLLQKSSLNIMSVKLFFESYVNRNAECKTMSLNVLSNSKAVNFIKERSFSNYQMSLFFLLINGLSVSYKVPVGAILERLGDSMKNL